MGRAEFTYVRTWGIKKVGELTLKGGYWQVPTALQMK